MRQYAYLKKPIKQNGNDLICKIMVYESEEGFYLFKYCTPDAVLCSSDQFYESAEDLLDEWNALIDENGWIIIEDPLPFCQHDAFLPVRVKGRDTGNPVWGQYEILQDGRWVPYEPVR